MRDRLAHVGRGLLAVAAVVGLAGCSLLNRPPSSPPVDDRVNLTPVTATGIWQSPRGGTITVSENGRFAAVGLPYQVFAVYPGVLPSNFDKDHDVITASGTWSLDAPIGDLNGPRNQLTLHTREVMGRPDSGSVALRAEMQGSDVVMSFYIGDPDLNNRIVYTKCTSNCPTVTPKPTG